jgi:hypothetical protein
LVVSDIEFGLISTQDLVSEYLESVEILVLGEKIVVVEEEVVIFLDTSCLLVTVVIPELVGWVVIIEDDEGVPDFEDLATVIDGWFLEKDCYFIRNECLSVKNDTAIIFLGLNIQRLCVVEDRG